MKSAWPVPEEVAFDLWSLTSWQQAADSRSSVTASLSSTSFCLIPELVGSPPVQL